MNREQIGGANIGALFYPQLERRDNQYIGYLKMRILKPGAKSASHSRSMKPDENFPLIFIPALWYKKKKKILFDPKEAFGAKKEDYDGDYHKKRKWDIFPIDIPAKKKEEHEKLGLLYDRLEQSLEKIVKGLDRLGEDSRSRRAFLGYYPDQIQEGFDPSQAYGVKGDHLKLYVCRQDLPSYDGGRVEGAIRSHRRIRTFR